MNPILLLPLLAEVLIAPQIVPDSIYPVGPPVVLSSVVPVDWSCNVASRSGEFFVLRGSLSGPVKFDDKIRREISLEGQKPMAFSGRGSVYWNERYGPIGSVRFHIATGETVYSLNMDGLEHGNEDGTIMLYAGKRPAEGKSTSWRPYAVGKCRTVVAKPDGTGQ